MFSAVVSTMGFLVLKTFPRRQDRYHSLTPQVFPLAAPPTGISHFVVCLPQETPSRPSSISSWKLFPRERTPSKSRLCPHGRGTNALRNDPLTLRLGILKISPKW